MSKLWQSKQLATLTDVFADGDWIESKDQSTDGIRLIQTGNVGEGAFKDRGEKARYISDGTFERLGCSEIFAGDCLVSRLPDPAGRSCIIPETGERMITAVDCTIIRFSPTQIIPEFFVYYSQSREYLAAVDREATGTTRKRISRSKLGEVLIPLPPLAEQRRIVQILDEAFASIAAAETNAEQNRKNARALFESRLHTVFTHRGPGWLETSLGEVCTFVGGSQPPKSVFTKSPAPDRVRLIQIRDYKSDKNVVYIPRSQAKRFCTAEDVMIGRYGPPIFQILRGLDGAYNVALMKAVPDETKIYRNFLFYFLKNPAILEYVIYHSQRAAGQIGLTKETLEPYTVALPPLDKQRVIASKIAALCTESQRLEALYARKLVALDELKAALLHRAFSGLL